jgi:UDP-N-acetylmuramoyl-L-alanyl-D-glutamate--2,6-diaminopimelate ligase
VRRLDGAPFPVRTYSSADLEEDGTFLWDGQAVAVPMIGAHNALNGLAAAHVAEVLGVDAGGVAAALRTAPDVRGRFERVDAGQPFSVLVVYSHTPDALRIALEEADRLGGSGRTLVVFGCGGDRDHTKRRPMGEVAAAHADVVVVTSDNPRSEDPQAIIAEVVAGTVDAPRRATDVFVDADRRAAIARAVSLAQAGDVVLLAGKGHETYQEVAGHKHHLDDREEALASLAALGWAVA